ncbi:hypothetical protein, variant [Verruconis gallopava]|uniref:BHLH domain-containing protein n=1 Tax=Verruconis gallopava TaxID=253628 RepID=A0A0D1XY14_9PEZI|nr:hypothetical protein, variant [Verruconis gallopava]KIW07706.1 hypothetical protein, variant [Verruconis gallopava]
MAMNPDSQPLTSYQASVLPPQSLPPITTLTNELPPPEPSPNLIRRQQEDAIRDSGNFSLASQSKHSSAISSASGLHLQTILNNNEDSPPRNSMPETPHSGRGSLQPNLPSLNQGFDQNRASVHSTDAALLDSSRRSSVDSRMNVGMGHLQISPQSPYDSQNASRASLASGLQQARVPNGLTPLSPTGTRLANRAHVVPRRAPVIANPRAVSGMPDPTAAAPTKGFAWAFPDQESLDDRRGSSSEESHDGRGNISRQNSYAQSIASSILTTDSALPPGQKRFDDGDLHTHHHSIQHRSVTSLQNNEQGGLSVSGTGSYSRTPELRVSHKMAERKRRSEMKQLFDELNSILPNSPGGKSSKWEILTKAIEHIRHLKSSDTVVRRDAERLKMELDMSRRNQDEIRALQAEITHLWSDVQRLDPGRNHVYGNFTHSLAQEHARTASGGPPSTMLPPVQSAPAAQWGQASSGAMSGVEYSGQPAQHYDRR